MTHDMTASWVVLIALGAFHGINPGMGWLFAVALGLQEQRRAAVLRALVPLGVGHALAVAVAVILAAAVGAVIPVSSLKWPIAASLKTFGVLRLVRHRHPRWAGMRVSMRGLTLWSFMMATAHGAGLMVVPVFMTMSTVSASGHAHHMMMATAQTSATTATVATGLHAVGYLAVTAVVALLVFEKLGVGVLRRVWFNVDLLWAAALVLTGAMTLFA
jgi:hypothetical protein